MSRLQTYLVEGMEYDSPRSKIIEPYEAIESIKKNCRKMLRGYKAGGSIIARGVNKISKALYIDPEKSVRISANTYNYYTLMMDNFKSWSKYPKRSKSIICSIDKNIMKSINNVDSYGTPYIVFPYDRCKIGIVNSYDLWDGFRFLQGFYGMQDFVDIIHGIFQNREVDVKKAQVDWKYFKEMWSKHSDILLDSFHNNEIFKDLDKLELKDLEKKMDPDYNKFRLVSPGKLPRVNDKECWVGNGPSILVKMKYEHKSFIDWWFDVIERLTLPH